MNWKVDNKLVMSYELDTTGAIRATNSIRVDYDLDKSPNYGSVMLYPDNEGDASPAKYDGIKLVLKASCPARLMVRPSCDWVGGNLWIDVGPEAKEYTIRFEDIPFESSNFNVATAGGFNVMSISFFNEDAMIERGTEQPSGFQHTGSVWFEDVYLFEGDDATNLAGSRNISVLKNPNVPTSSSADTLQTATSLTAVNTTQAAGSSPVTGENGGLTQLALLTAVSTGLCGVVLFRKRCRS